MMACRSGCATQDHASYGECLKAANLKVGYCRSHIGVDYTREKRWEKELSDYRAARSNGIQPATTRANDVKAAVAISDATGQAYNAGV